MPVNMTFNDSIYIQTRQNFIIHYFLFNILIIKMPSWVDNFCTRIKNAEMFSIKTFPLWIAISIHSKHQTLHCKLHKIIVLISVVSTNDVRLPHHKSLEEIYYRFCEFSRVKHMNEKIFWYWITLCFKLQICVFVWKSTKSDRYSIWTQYRYKPIFIYA